MTQTHTFWLADGESRALGLAVRSRLPSRSGIELSAGDGPAETDAGVVARRVPLPSDVLREPVSVVLVAPDLEERDRVESSLAGWERTALVIIDNPAPAIHAERTLALILALASGLPQAISALARSNPDRSALVTGEPVAESWLSLPQPAPVRGRRLGFVGFGRMGRELASMAAALGMENVYWPEPGTPREEQEILAAAARSRAVELPFDQLLQTSDVVVIDVGSGEATSRLIGAPEIALMREDALLVSTTNGRAIDEGALIQALRGGYLGGVALDVFNYEPLPADSPLRNLDRALLTPRITRPDASLVNQLLADRLAAALLELSGSPLRPRRVRRVERKRG